MSAFPCSTFSYIRMTKVRNIVKDKFKGFYVLHGMKKTIFEIHWFAAGETGCTTFCRLLRVVLWRWVWPLCPACERVKYKCVRRCTAMSQSGILQLCSLLHKCWSRSSLWAAVCPSCGYPDQRNLSLSRWISGLSKGLENRHFLPEVWKTQVCGV